MPAVDLSGVLAGIQAGIQDRLQAKHDAREAALRDSRQAIRHAANAIRAAHRGEHDAAEALVEQSGAALRAAIRACDAQPEIEHAGFVHDAQKEFAEASTTLALIAGRPLPQPGELDVSDSAYLNGLAETVGELRRHLLDLLRSGQVERCEELLDAMDEIYAVLVTIDFPDAVTAGLRRSTDVARSIIERTRGDFTSALLQARLQQSLEATRAALRG